MKCKKLAKNIQLKKPDTEREVHDVEVKYVLPEDMAASDEGIHGLIFKQYDHFVHQGKHKRLSLYRTDNGLKIERRNDNGVSGSSRIYMVDIFKENKEGKTTVTFKPQLEKTSQDGVILVFPVPKLDVKSYLSQASIHYSFEMNSDYPVDSIKANFERVLKVKDGAYKPLKMSSSQALLNIKTYPYRHATKVVVNSTLLDMSAVNNVIDVTKSIEELKQKVKEIIDL